MVEVGETSSEFFFRTAITPNPMYFEANGQLKYFLEISRHKKAPNWGLFYYCFNLLY
jgi:hypothetical protein